MTRAAAPVLARAAADDPLKGVNLLEEVFCVTKDGEVGVSR